MAKCRGCGIEIPEGSEYCAECLSKLNTAKDSESYLDSLLSAVMTEESERREIVYPKREASSLVSVPETVKTEEPAEDLQADFPEEPEEIPADDFLQEFMNAQEDMSEQEEEIPPMEDVFGMFFDGDTELPDLKNYSIFEDVDERTVDRMLAEELGESDAWSGEEESFSEEEEDVSVEEFGDLSEFYSEDSEETEEVPLSEVGDIEDLFGMLEDERGENAPEEIAMAIPEVISADELDSAADTFSGIVEAPEEEGPAFADLADLFGGAEEVPAEAPEEEALPEFGDFADLFGEGGDTAQEDTPAQSQKSFEASMDDFADLFSGMDGGDGLFEFGAEPIMLEDDSPSEDDLLSAMMVGTPEPAETEPEEAQKADGKKKKEKGGLSALFHKLFDNVKVDPSKIKKQPTKEELEAQKKAKQEAKEKSKEEKEALLAEKREQDKQVKLEKQRVAKEAKAEKKAKKMEEAKLLLEEMERTRINRAGASIVFIFFAMIAVVIIVGTSIFSYSLSIKNAEYEFENDRYTAAYNEIYGLEIKDEDILLYDRIMTVMYVQKQLNSYYNYYGMNDKPKALDSLLKGLQRYEKYIELAVELDVDSDLDSVRKKILAEISTSFAMTEQEAMEIIQSDSQAEYSRKVYDAVENMDIIE